jgi:glucose/arabinose dehydrogenase
MEHCRLRVRSLILIVLVCLSWGTHAQDTFTPQTFTDAETGVTYRLERYMLAQFPVGMVFLPDGTLLYNEKITGNVRLVSPDGKLQTEPVIHLPTNALQERGMLGLALDPNFAENSYVYVVHTREGTSRDYPANELVRFTLVDGIGQNPQVLASYPITTGELLHNGGNVVFDSEGYLYLTLGDFGDSTNSQNLESPLGKVLRFEVTDEGLVPAPNNPFGDDNPAYAIGFRNPYDLTFDTETQRIFVAEVGPNCDDELNILIGGFNYGWREDYECVGDGLVTDVDLYLPPILSFNPVEAPTGLLVYRGEMFPEWQGDLLLCNWNFGDLRRITLSDTGIQAEAVSTLDLGGVGCRIDLVEAPDGSLYFGTVEEGSGAIMRISR